MTERERSQIMDYLNKFNQEVRYAEDDYHKMGAAAQLDSIDIAVKLHYLKRLTSDMMDWVYFTSMEEGEEEGEETV